MRNILLIIIFICLSSSFALASEWKDWADAAVTLSPGAICELENKKEKTKQNVYILTILYYRDNNHVGLKKLFDENVKNITDGPVLKVLKAIILMREHKHQESRNILTGVLQTHPDFYPALIVLSHLHYVQKNFAGAYDIARQLIEKKEELSRYHYMLSLLIATGSKGILAKKNMLTALPAYFEVKGYLAEAQSLMPDSAEVLYGVGSFHLLTPHVAGGNLDKAIWMLEKSKAISPLNTNVHVRLAQAYLAKGDTMAYQKNIARAKELDPRDEVLLDYLSGEKAFLDVR
jgi:tetratricopeptide (TPR) repeat protein